MSEKLVTFTLPRYKQFICQIISFRYNADIAHPMKQISGKYKIQTNAASKVCYYRAHQYYAHGSLWSVADHIRSKE